LRTLWGFCNDIRNDSAISRGEDECQYDRGVSSLWEDDVVDVRRSNVGLVLVPDFNMRLSNLDVHIVCVVYREGELETKENQTSSSTSKVGSRDPSRATPGTSVIVPRTDTFIMK